MSSLGANEIQFFTDFGLGAVVIWKLRFKGKLIQKPQEIFLIKFLKIKVDFLKA